MDQVCINTDNITLPTNPGDSVSSSFTLSSSYSRDDNCLYYVTGIKNL